MSLNSRVVFIERREHVSIPQQQRKTHVRWPSHRVTDRDPSARLTSAKTKSTMNFAGNRATITESTGTLAKTPKPPPTIVLEVYWNKLLQSYASESFNRTESRSHPSSGPHHHNEPFTHLEHSRGNKTTPSNLAILWPAITTDDERNGSKKSTQHHQSFIAGYKHRIVLPKEARTTRSKAGYTPSKGLPCTRIGNYNSWKEPPRLSISQKISERRERESTIPSILFSCKF